MPLFSAIILAKQPFDAAFVWQTITSISVGLKYTLGLFAITIVLSIPLGLLLCFAETGRNRVIAKIVQFYVFIMRGTPLLLQLFFIYFGLPYLPYIGKYLVMERFTAACVAFVLNYAAYLCEIFRGGLMSIDRGQYEAAKVLGLTRFQTTMHIVIPQMIKVVLPPVSNEAITLVKDTALASSISIIDLMHLAKTRVNATANVFPFLIAAVFYLTITYVLTKLSAYLEKKYKF